MKKFATEVYAGCIDIYENIIDNSKELIELSEHLNKWEDATVINNASPLSHIEKNTRSNKLFIPDTEIAEFKQMFDTVSEYIKDYANKYGASYSYIEKCQILKYNPGDFFVAHNDDGKYTLRVISGILYLNTVDGGGETEFVYHDTWVSPVEGRLVLFPSNYAYRHRAISPHKSTKYAVVFWTRM